MGVYKRGAVWYIRYQVDGRDIVKSAGKSATQKSAAELLKELKEKARAQKLGIAIDGLLTEALVEWIERGDADLKAPGKIYGLRPTSWTRYKVSIAQINAYPKTTGAMVSEIGQSWIAGFVKHRQTVDKVSNRTIRRDLDALSDFFQWLIGEGRVEHNRVRDYDISAIPEFKTEIRVPTVREIQMVIDTFHGMLARMVAFQALMGLRQGEALDIEWADYDAAAKTLTIPKSKTNWPRTVHLYQSAIEILESLPKPPDHLTAPRGGYIFWHGDGETYANFPSMWGHIVHDLLGLDMTDHNLRHFAAWLYLRRGGRLVGLKDMLGHKKSETTEQYAHIAEDLQRYDLIVMGERPAVANPEQFNVRFSFEKSGPILEGAELKERSARVHGEIRRRRVVELLRDEHPEAFGKRILRDPAWLPPLREKLGEMAPELRAKAARIIASVERAAAAGKTNKRWPQAPKRHDTNADTRSKTVSP